MLLAGCSNSNTSLKVNAVAGPYLQQLAPGSVASQLGTGFLIELRQDGERISADAQVSVTGPEGWNSDQLVAFDYPAGSFWTTAQEMSAAPIAGEYVVTVRSGDTFTSVRSTVTSLEPLELPMIEATESDDELIVSWLGIGDAAGYYVSLVDRTGSLLGGIEYVTDTMVTVSARGLDGAQIKVHAANFDTVADVFTFPKQLRMSEGVVEVDSE